MNTILLIWTVVGMSGTYGAFVERDWRPLGEFNTPAACREAARQLALPDTKFRCISKITGAAS
jgi:hypothetical protein